MKNLTDILFLFGILLIVILIVLFIIYIILPLFNKEKLTDNHKKIKTKINEDNFYFIIDNFLTDEECDHIIDVSKDKL